MSSPLLRPVVLAVVLLAPAPAVAQPAGPASPPSTDWLEFEASLKGMFESDGEVAELVARMKGRGGRLDTPEKRDAAAAVKAAVARGLAPDAPREARVFAAD